MTKDQIINTLLNGENCTEQMGRIMENYWMIDDCSTKFDTLRDAKNHTTFWTKKELEAYDGSAVMHIIGEKIVSICTMHVRNGRANFSKVFKIQENRVF